MNSNNKNISIQLTQQEATFFSSISCQIVQHQEFSISENDEKDKTSSQKNSQIKDALFLRKRDSYYKVLYNDILFIEVEKGYCEFQTSNQKYFHKTSLIKVAQFLPNYFVQIHRNKLINLHLIEKFCLHKRELTIGKHIITMGRKYQDQLICSLQTLT